MAFDITYRKTSPESTDYCLIYKDNSVLCKTSCGEIYFPTVKEITELFPDTAAHMRYLFKIDAVCFFTYQDFSPEESGEFTYLTKTELRIATPQWKAFAAVTGMQIFNWYRSVSFCGFCGERTVHSETERAAVCMKCGTTFYPKICPGVIVGIKNEDKLLLTKYSESHSPHRNYSLVAGYNEVGETLEDTVRREVMEEVGLKVKNIRYYKSQPWPFSDSLLVGFFCELDGGCEITLDKTELSLAQWMSREDIPESAENYAKSLTGDMIRAFRKGEIK